MKFSYLSKNFYRALPPLFRKAKKQWLRHHKKGRDIRGNPVLLLFTNPILVTLANKYQQLKMQAFISYSHNDSRMLDLLHRHLAQLRRDETISARTDIEIPAGGDFGQKIFAALGRSNLLIAILSPGLCVQLLLLINL